MQGSLLPPSRIVMEFASLASFLGSTMKTRVYLELLARLWAKFRREHTLSSSLANWNFTIGRVDDAHIISMTETRTMVKFGGHICRKCLAWKETVRHKCSRCRRAYYCSQQCQQSDWPMHKGECCQTLALLDQALPPFTREFEANSLSQRQMFKAMHELLCLHAAYNIECSARLHTTPRREALCFHRPLIKNDASISDGTFSITLGHTSESVAWQLLTTADTDAIVHDHRNFIMCYEPGEGICRWLIDSSQS